MPTDICRWLFLLISLSTWITFTNTKDIRVVCYYTNWSVYRPGTAKFGPQNINPYLCTHLIYAFGGFTKENTLKPFDKYQDIEKGGYAKFTGLKTYNKNLKTLLAIGGWNEGSSRFSPMVASSERRKELVKNTVKFLRQNHFDGLDLDWEYPTFRDGGKSRDRENYAQLVKELREEFERESEKTGRTRLLLTMAVPAGIEYINKGYDVPKLTKYLDWMNILSYDYHSAFEPAVNHHAPLYGLEEDSEYNYDADLNIDHTIKHYLELGADSNKLVLGIPTYGRSYTLYNPDANELGAPADGPGDMGEATRENGYLAYYEICNYIKSEDWEVVQPDEDAMGPYAFKGNQWVGYDDEKISRKKAEYVAKNNLGGIMFWAIDNDDFRGNCHGKPYPLIEAAKEALLNAYGITDDNLIAPTSKPIKQKTRTRTKVSSKDESDNQVSTSGGSRRRNRVKPKEPEAPRETNRSRQKSRRKQHKNTEETTSTYSSLKVVTPSYTTPAPPSTPDQGGAFKCEDEGFFPHPKDCKKYFWCLSGAGDSGIVAHQFTCPAGLYFNKAADSCDYTQNVLCNKKLSRTTAAEPTKTTDSSTTSKSTLTSLFSTTRAPPKITAATSRTTFTFKTTEASVEEDEYEEYDDDEDYEEDRKIDSEDPKVIKELIDLIKKAGGIEELEKRLRGDTQSSTGTNESTTQSAISKSLVARVLGQNGRNKITKANTFSFTNKNSRGSQTDGLSKTSDSKSTSSKTERGRPQYTTISRFRTTVNKENEEGDSEDDENVKDKPDDTVKSIRNFKKNSTPEYVNIRRAKVSTTTEENDRNKILGEDENEPDDDDDDDNDGYDTNKKSTPQYVNIRRQHTSTTEESVTSKYKEIRRGSVNKQVDETDESTSKYKSIRREPSQSVKETEEDNNNSKYKSIRRGSSQTVKEVAEEENNSRYKTTTPGTAFTEENNLTSLRYKTLQRGTTTSSGISDEPKYKLIRGSTTPSEDNEASSKYKLVQRGTTTPATTEGTEISSKYNFVRRGSTTLSAKEDDAILQRRRGTTTQSTISADRENEINLKIGVDSTTVSSNDNDNDITEITTRLLPQVSSTSLPSSPESQNGVELSTASPSDLTYTTSTNLEEEPTTVLEGITDNTTGPILTTKLIAIETPTETILSSTETTTETISSSTIPRRTPPTLLEPRPFSIRGSTSTTSKSKTESSTETSKVSESNFKLRLRTKPSFAQNGIGRNDNSLTTTESSINSSKFKRRGYSRFNIESGKANVNVEENEDNEFEEPDVNSQVRSRKRFSTTEKNINEELAEQRTYRPAELADLSSLTAIDLSVLKGFKSQNGFKRGRGRGRVQTTIETSTPPEKEKEEEEILKTSSRTLPLARKFIQNTTFGKGKRIISTKATGNDDEADSNVKLNATRPRLRGVSQSIENTPSTPSNIKTRKVIRRFRSTTVNSLDVDNENDFKIKEFSSLETSSKSAFVGFKRNEASDLFPKNSIKDILNKRPIRLPSIKNTADDNDDSDDISTEEEENIKLSESNIRENSDVNSLSAKEFRKLGIYKSKVQGKSDIVEKTSNVDSNLDEIVSTTTTTTTTTTEDTSSDITLGTSTTTVKPSEPPIIIRTRKIIRKLRPTQPTLLLETTTQHFNVSERSPISNTTTNIKRKIIRRLRPTTTTTTPSITTGSETKKRKFILRGRPTTEEPTVVEVSTNLNAEKETDTLIRFKPNSRFNRPAQTRNNLPTVTSTTPSYKYVTQLTEEKGDGLVPSLRSTTSTPEDDDDEYEDDDDDEEEEELRTDNRSGTHPVTTERTSSIRPVPSPNSLLSKTKLNALLTGVSKTPSSVSEKEVTSEVSTSLVDTKSRSENEEDDDEYEDDEEYDDDEDDDKENGDEKKTTPLAPLVETSTLRNTLLHRQGERPSFVANKLNLNAKTDKNKEIVKPSTRDYRTKPRPSFKRTETTSTTESLPLFTKAKYKFYTRSTTLSSVSTEPSTQSTVKSTTTQENQNVENIENTTVNTDNLQESNNTTDLDNVTTTENIQDSEKSTTTVESTEISTETNINDITTSSSIISENITDGTTLNPTTTTIDSISEITDSTTKETELQSLLENGTNTNLEENITTEEINVLHEITTVQVEVQDTTEDSTESIITTESVVDTESTLNTTSETTTQSTTPYIPKSTLRPINSRPKFNVPKRTSLNKSTLETTTKRQNRFSLRNKSRLSSETDTLTVNKVPSIKARPSSTTAIPINKFIYKYSTTAKPRYTHKEEVSDDDGGDDDEDEDEEYDDEEEEDDEDEEKVEVKNNKVSSPKPFTFNRPTTPKIINSPVTAKKVQNVPFGKPSNKTTKVVNKPRVVFQKTTTAPVTESLIDIDTEAIKNRNKNLFSKKRTMNTPFVGPSSTPTLSEVMNSTEEFVTLAPQITEPITKPSVSETTEPLTTLHHIFAEAEDDINQTTTESSNKSVESSKVEKLIEVNRIIKVYAKEAKLKNHTLQEQTKVEKVPVVDKIGAINRVTVIKIVDGNNVTQTIEENSFDNEINSKLPNTTDSLLPNVEEVTTVANNDNSKQPVTINIRGTYIIPELAIVKEISANDTLLTDSIPSNHRQDRKYELYGESKVHDYKSKNSFPNEIIKPGLAEIIDGNSQVNIITPRPILSTEASTISLERLFLTDTPRNIDNIHGNLIQVNTNEELLETQNSRFVNVRILEQGGARTNKGLRDDSPLLPIRVLKQDVEEVTMKAHVVEVSPRDNKDTIKIVPIKVEMSRKLANEDKVQKTNVPFVTNVESGVPKVNIKLITP